MTFMKYILPALVLSVPAPSFAAENVAETIFAESALADAPIGATFSYDYRIVAPDGTEIQSFDTGSAMLDIVESADGGKAVVISLDRGGTESELNELPATGGNPLVLIFLEQTARAMAELTGGSPYYIRNRMKEALLQPGEREEVPREDGTSTRIVLRPFAGDPNRDKMGEFYDIEVTFVQGKDVPGGIAELDARVAGTGDAPIYRQTLTFQGMEAPR